LQFCGFLEKFFHFLANTTKLCREILKLIITEKFIRRLFMAEVKQKQEKTEKKKTGTGILHYLLVMIISALVAVIVLTQYRMQYFQKDIFSNVGIVNTTLLIQEQRLSEMNNLRKGKSDSSSNLSKYIQDMQEIVDSIAKKYDVILLERGAVISGDFVDLTEEVRQRLINRGYDFLKDQDFKNPKNKQ